MTWSPQTYAATAPTGGFGMTEAYGLLKEWYTKRPIKAMSYAKSPVLAMMRKEQAGGEYYVQPVISESGGGGSASLSTSITNQTPLSTQKFIITRAKAYQVATIDRETWLAGSYDEGAFLKTAVAMVDQAVAAISQDISVNLFRDGTGFLGTYAVTDISTGVITLDDPNSVTGFRRGDVLESRATKGGTISSGGALGYVFAINRTAGTITVATSLANAASGTAGTPSSWSGGTNTVLNRQGNNNAVSSGFQAWVPATAPTSGNPFFAVDRYIDSRLYGSSYNGANQSIEEAIVDAAAVLDQEGGNPDVCILSTRGYAALEKAMIGRTVYDTWEDKELGISFRGLVLNTANGTVRVFSDRYCPGKTGFLLQMDSWVMFSLLEVPHIVDEDNDQRMLRQATNDSYELRVSALYNVACGQPGFNAQLTLVA